MRKRFKRLKKKVYSYEQLCKKIKLWQGRPEYSEKVRPPCPLYGGLTVRYHEQQNCFFIIWSGSLARAGGPREEITITVASVQRAVMNGSLYCVNGLQVEDSSPARYGAALRVWRRYVKAFTPHDTKQHMRGKETAVYVVSGGLCSRVTNTADIPGVWMSRPAFVGLRQQEWLKGWPGTDEFRGLPKFRARSRRFVRDLKQRLAEIGKFEVLRVLPALGPRGRQEGRLTIDFCTPPTRTKNGKRYLVSMAPHDAESREHFGISVEYGKRHSQYWVHGIQQPVRYKCGKDALSALVETALGSIYIPGPE
jgi:hypothetical protein